MMDLRPVGYVIGLLVAVLGAAMLLPMIIDIAEARGHWPVFLQSSLVTVVAGGLIALSCANGVKEGLTIQQTFLLTTGVWVALPVFGAIPFVIGATEARFVDAFFEAMSGLTTTGSTVFTELEMLPKGLLLWRGILQWLGGIGIIVVAMVFLPELRVGGKGSEASSEVVRFEGEVGVQLDEDLPVVNRHGLYTCHDCLDDASTCLASAAIGSAHEVDPGNGDLRCFDDCCCPIG